VSLIELILICLIQSLQRKNAGAILLFFQLGFDLMELDPSISVSLSLRT
jgi:hypothetical protein